MRLAGRFGGRAGARPADARAAGIALLVSAGWLCAVPAAALASTEHNAAVPPPALQVTAAGLIEESTGQQLYGVNPNAERPIASTTKLMTALITLEHVRRPATVFTQNDYYAAGGDSEIGLAPGDRMTVHDLLIALLLPSADDAAEDLAYNVGGGSVPRFIAMMNAQAQALGLTHTHYSTPIGLDTPGNYSSAYDLDKLADYVLRHSPLFKRIVALPEAKLKTGPVRTVVNRNDLVGRVSWINGVKTGHTNGAGYVLVASGTRYGMTLIGAVLGTSSEATRDQNALALLNYGFATFRLVKPVTEGRVMAEIGVKGRPYARADAVAAASFVRVIKRSDTVGVSVKVPRVLRGPKPAHTVIGTATVLIDQRPVARIPLELATAILAPPPPPAAAGGITGRTLTLILLAVAFVVLVLTGFGWWRYLRMPAGDGLEVR